MGQLRLRQVGASELLTNPHPSHFHDAGTLRIALSIEVSHEGHTVVLDGMIAIQGQTHLVRALYLVQVVHLTCLDSSAHIKQCTMGADANAKEHHTHCLVSLLRGVKRAHWPHVYDGVTVRLQLVHSVPSA